MEFTYSVEAKCNGATGMDVTFKGFVEIGDAVECALTLQMAFPEVVIMNDLTGEVMYSHYESVDLYRAQTEMGRAVMRAECDRCF